jgi:hypothetical protein
MFTSPLNERIYAFAARVFRRKRFAVFEQWVGTLPKPLSVLDVGGSRAFWDRMGHLDDLQVTLLNYDPGRAGTAEMVAGDAQALPYRDRSFDLVFSNSVIEHMGSRAGQARMAEEVRRVGKRYFVQTPNRRFPIEPHFLIPFFQFLPAGFQERLLVWLKVEYFSVRITTIKQARAAAGEIVLLSKREFRAFFPGGTQAEERILGMAKSFTMYGEME